MRNTISAGVILVLAAATVAALDRTPSAPGAEAYIIQPRNGETVVSPFRVVFGLRGMGVAPAGVAHPKTGHHHLVIDTELPALSAPIPKSARLLHFGGGQTETVLDLPAGRHTLQLLLGDHLHFPHEPPVASAPITIVVK